MGPCRLGTKLNNNRLVFVERRRNFLVYRVMGKQRHRWQPEEESGTFTWRRRSTEVSLVLLFSQASWKVHRNITWNLRFWEKTYCPAFDSGVYQSDTSGLRFDTLNRNIAKYVFLSCVVKTANPTWSKCRTMLFHQVTQNWNKRAS